MNIIKPVSDRWGDRLIALLVIGSIVVMSLSVLFGVLSATGAWSASDASASVKTSQAIGSCRSTKNAAVQQTGSELLRAIGDLQALSSNASLAQITNDRPEFERLLAAAPAAIQRVSDAGVANAAAAADYTAASALADADPAAFLAACNGGRG